MQDFRRGVKLNFFPQQEPFGYRDKTRWAEQAELLKSEKLIVIFFETWRVNTPVYRIIKFILKKNKVLGTDQTEVT